MAKSLVQRLELPEFAQPAQHPVYKESKSIQPPGMPASSAQPRQGLERGGAGPRWTRSLRCIGRSDGTRGQE